MFLKLNILDLFLSKADSLAIDFITQQIYKKGEINFLVHKRPHSYGNDQIFILALYVLQFLGQVKI